MKNYPNIEKSAFRKGMYVGYGDGVWHIIRLSRSKVWHAAKVDGGARFTKRTLAEISETLAHRASVQLNLVRRYLR